MWKTRNDAIHNKEDSSTNKKQHEDLDRDIDNIFRDLPPGGEMPTCDAAFFKRGSEKMKRYRLRRKEVWVADAVGIKEAFYYPDSDIRSLSELFRDPSANIVLGLFPLGLFGSPCLEVAL